MAIYKTTRGYTIRYYDADGRERQQTYKGIARKEAKTIEREKLAERDRGEAPVDQRQTPTFSSFAAAWKDEHRAGWKASTVEQYENVLAQQLLPTFGELRVAQVTEPRVLAWLTALHDRGLGARRTNLALTVLRMILASARRRRWLREDPLVAVRALKTPPVDIDPLAPDEVTAFLEACAPYWRPYFVVAFWTGARPNELAALKVSDIDWTAARFRIRAGRYRGVEGPPKTTHSVRDVDMLRPVIDALRVLKASRAAARLKAGQGTPEPGADYVFVGTDGGNLNPNWLRDRIWYHTLAKAGLRRRTMYQTRHSFASNALAAGEQPLWVSAMLGHATPRMLFQVYARWIPNRTRRDGSALAARMGGDTGLLRASEPGAAEER
jgi:integrase